MKKIILATTLALFAFNAHATPMAGDGVIVDGLNFVLAGQAQFTNLPTSSDQQTYAKNWILNCDTEADSQTCPSPFANWLKTNNPSVKYLLIDFPYFGTLTGSAITQKSSCDTTTGNGHYTTGLFNYFQPYNSGGDPMCKPGQAITASFAQYGQKVIPLISVSGGDLVTYATNNYKSVTIGLQSLATSIAAQINNDRNAAGVAFDTEPMLAPATGKDGEPVVGTYYNAFFGKLASLIKPKPLMIYDASATGINGMKKNFTIPSNMIILGAMYDFASYDGSYANPNNPKKPFLYSHANQAHTPEGYDIIMKNIPGESNGRFAAFINGFFGQDMPNQLMAVLPAAGSTTDWGSLSIYNDSSPDKPGDTTYDPYDKSFLQPETSTDYAKSIAAMAPNLDVNPLLDIPEEHKSTNPTPPLPALATYTETESPSLHGTTKTYTRTNSNGTPTKQLSYINYALSAITNVNNTSSAPNLNNGSKKILGVILYNEKPSNFYQLACANPDSFKYKCLGFGPDNISPEIYDALNTWRKTNPLPSS